MRNELQCVLDAVREMPPDQLPELLGELEVVRATAMMKLSAPAPAHPPQQADALLDVTEAAQRLGMSEKYLYRHASRLPFTRHMGRSLRFSSFGIAAYLKQKR